MSGWEDPIFQEYINAGRQNAFENFVDRNAITPRLTAESSVTALDDTELTPRSTGHRIPNTPIQPRPVVNTGHPMTFEKKAR
jgi:hypothetical protein